MLMIHLKGMLYGNDYFKECLNRCKNKTDILFLNERNMSVFLHRKLIEKITEICYTSSFRLASREPRFVEADS